MDTYNIHEAKTHLSRLIAQVQSGETVLIAKSGKPVAKLTAVRASKPAERRRFGFLKGQITVPDDFGAMAAVEIEKLFEGRE